MPRDKTLMGVYEVRMAHEGCLPTGTYPTYLLPTQPSPHHSREVLILTLSIFNALDVCISWYSLCPRECTEKYFPRECISRTLPRENIGDTSSRGKHWQCPGNDESSSMMKVAHWWYVAGKQNVKTMAVMKKSIPEHYKQHLEEKVLIEKMLMEYPSIWSVWKTEDLFCW